jgi:hypothetical protein
LDPKIRHSILKAKMLNRFAEMLDGPMCFDKSLLLALFAHGGQRDKGGWPYIIHVISVALEMDTEDEMCAAVMHDGVEDTKGKPNEVLLSDLPAFGYSSYQTMALDAVTKQDDDESYMWRILNVIMRNDLASKIKRKDIRHNMRLDRLKNKKLTAKDWDRQQNYIDALTALEGGIKR